MKKGAILEVVKNADPGDYVGTVVRIPTKLVKQLPGQPRTHFDSVQMKRLRDSIAEIGQQQPATVIPWQDATFRLRDGERRWRCCVELRIPLLALVVEAKSSEEEFELSTAANMNRESHSPLEKALAMKRLRDGPLKRSITEIARTFGVTETTVHSHLLVIDSLPQPVLDLMDPNKHGSRKHTLQMTCAVHLTSLIDHPREQLRIAQRIVRDSLTMSHAMRLIDQFADSKNITAGRGRERKQSDHLRMLTSAIHRMQPHVEHFCRQQQRQINELFEFVPLHRHEELTERIEKAIEALEQLQKKIAAVESIGIRRQGAA